MSKDNHTILNEIMIHAAEIMQNKIDYNELVIEQRIEKYGKRDVTAFNLKTTNEKIADAKELIYLYDGCWV